MNNNWMVLLLQIIYRSILPQKLQNKLDRKISVVTKKTTATWKPPANREWATKCEMPVLPYDKIGSLTPHYYINNCGWSLILPTSVGNVILEFDYTNSSNVVVTTPTLLAPMINTVMANLDDYMTTFYYSQGGSSDDCTLGRLIEQSIMDKICEKTFYLLSAILLIGLTFWCVS